MNETHVYLLWLNRPQNQRIFALYDLSPQSVTLHPVREISESSPAWIQVSNVRVCAHVQHEHIHVNVDVYV